MLPNLIIIGAMKCATTSLHYYLSLHPQVLMSKKKELDFFVREKQWDKGIEWYKSNFTGEAKVHGESSPNYTLYPIFSGVPERMHSVVPHVKLIYVVRDPLQRMVSHYIHEYTKGRESRQIAEALQDFDSRYFYRSKYYMQLERYLNYFSRSQILVISHEDLLSDRRQSLQKVFRFLNIDETFYCRQFSNLKHISSRKRQKNRVGIILERALGTANSGMIGQLPPRMRWYTEKLVYLPFSSEIEAPSLNEGVRQKLVENLKDDIKRLRKYTGGGFENWCL